MIYMYVGCVYDVGIHGVCACDVKCVSVMSSYVGGGFVIHMYVLGHVCGMWGGNVLGTAPPPAWMSSTLPSRHLFTPGQRGQAPRQRGGAQSVGRPVRLWAPQTLRMINGV